MNAKAFLYVCFFAKKTFPVFMAHVSGTNWSSCIFNHQDSKAIKSHIAPARENHKAEQAHKKNNNNRNKENKITRTKQTQTQSRHGKADMTKQTCFKLT